MRKIAVLLSGGVDSLVTAGLLKEQGFTIFGIHFYTGYENSAPAVPMENSPSEPISGNQSHHAAIATADRLHQQLDIPVEVQDARKAFQSIVVDYFIHSYQVGRTPNPCMVCNPFIKFGLCLTLAEKMGASHLATGHYARVNQDSQGMFHLYRGNDLRKDQSYFLARLNQDMLSRAVFPLGTYTKAQTISQARQWGLNPVAPRESQDICFIQNNAYGDFLAQHPGFMISEGPIETIDGRVIGKHQGLHRYTIGQRRGINIPAAEPYYVIRIDAEKNRLVVGSKQATLSDTCSVADIQWIHEPPDKPVRIATRIRYRHQSASSQLTVMNGNKAHIRFDRPQSAITPGQAAVFYQGDEVLGGGWIEYQLSIT
jgi:tRNA-uridine 2-sulfurtransferase